MKKAARIEAQARIDTPLGPLTLAATANGLAGAWFDGQKHHPGTLAAPERPDHPHIERAVRALRDYWAGESSGIEIDLDAAGTAFQCAVWQALREIEPGATRSYGEIASRIGRPAAVRAVGAAVGRNPISVIVPCHRVIGRDGSLTGYAGGLDRKRSLLAHERSAR
jgi:methylated-DNA-[protein]-cysteine S-methyltransferase